jgi:integrase
MASQNPQSVQVVSKRALGRLARTNVEYWKSRLFKNTYSRDGTVFEINEYSVKIQHLGIRKTFALGTSNKDAAAAKAKEIHRTITGKGWDAANAEFAPDMALSRRIATVGAFVAEVKASSHLKAGTFEIYAKKFRTVVAGVFNLRGGKDKFDYVNGGREKWLERVHRVRLDKLTAKRIEAWKMKYLQTAARKDPLTHKRAKTTLNSLLRGGKSLFAADVLKHLTVELPKPLPFDGVENVTLPRTRYKSEIEPQLLLVAAQRELAQGIVGANKTCEPKPDLFTILLLALGAGLRRDEIDTLTWKQMQWHRNIIRIETNIHTAAKSDESENEVDVDPQLMEVLRGYMAQSKGEFVIASKVAPRPTTSTYHHYRCERHFGELIAWLRSKGITARNPLHTLRKEFGSQICAQAGIFAASTALRHANISLTRSVYVDKKQPTFFAVGKLLNPSETSNPKASEGAA